MLGDLGGWHFLIILAVVLLLFGATKLPALAKGVGQSVRIFRNEMEKTDGSAKKDGADERPAVSENTAHDQTPTSQPKE